MALYTVSNGMSINATDLNQIINELQRSTGTQEIGNYLLAGNFGPVNSYIGNWINLRSRYSTPVSVTVDTSTGAISGGLTSVNSGLITSSGFQVFGNSSAGNAANGRCSGIYTVSF